MQETMMALPKGNQMTTANSTLGSATTTTAISMQKQGKLEFSF
jgi:hypothetical protein